MKLQPMRVENVPVAELSGPAVVEAGAGRADVAETWELRVPERRGEPDGKPEGLVVTGDGTLIVGLDTETPQANLCWYRP